MNNELPTPVSYETALTSFLSHLKEHNGSSATFTAYRGDLTQLGRYLEEHRITQVTTVTSQYLSDYVAYISTTSYTPKSISRKINSMKTFFKFLVTKGMIQTNVAKVIPHPKFTTNPPRILIEAECKALQDICRLDIRMCAVIELLLQTGMRIGEVANLKMEDYRKNEIVIRVFENNPERVVPLSKNTVSALQNYLAVRPDVYEQTFFVTKTGHPLLIRNMRAAIDRYFRMAKIKDVKVNDLRHAFAAHQVKSGVSLEFLTKIMGHKRLVTLTQYLGYTKSKPGNLLKLVEL